MKPSTYKWIYLVAGITLRVGLLAWGDYQDRNHTVPYTDIDYSVFSDAAKFVVEGCPLSKTVGSANFVVEQDLANIPDMHCAKGVLPVAARFLLQNDPLNALQDENLPIQNDTFIYLWTSSWYTVARPVLRLLASLGDPYARPTYRYTPFLALVLTPIRLLNWINFGKYLFAIADVLCAVRMWAILDGRRPQNTEAGNSVHLPGLLWLLNPIPAQISTRGSSESLVGLSVLTFIYFFLMTNPEAPLGLIAVHSLSSKTMSGTKSTDNKSENVSEPIISGMRSYQPLLPEAALGLNQWSIQAYLSPIVLGLAVHLKIFPFIYGIAVLAHLSESTKIAYDPLTRNRLNLLTRHSAGIKFGVVAFATWMVANAIAWCLWGSPFIEHTFTYHLVRQDHRHNFSPYFFSTYLSSVPAVTEGGLGKPFLSIYPPFVSWLQSHVFTSPLLSFVPQMVLVATLGYRIGKKDVVMAMMTQTIAFVAFNKVCTSQYFLWFLWLLPIVWPNLELSKTKIVVGILLWVGGQALWLSQAYQLEFEGQEVFARIWASGLILLMVHTLLLTSLITAWVNYRIGFDEKTLVAGKKGLVDSRNKKPTKIKSQ